MEKDGKSVLRSGEEILCGVVLFPVRVDVA